MEPPKVCLQFVSLVVVLCSVGIEATAPSDADTTEANDLLIQASTVEIENTKFESDTCTLVVPENRNKANSRLIRLPVVRIHCTSQRPAEPVFLLAGGPGLSNIWTTPPKWLLQHHDVVMVGYRGFDGSVSLACPGAVEAAQVEDNPLSSENIRRLGMALYRGFERLKKEGVEVDGYTIIEVIEDIECVRKKLGYEKVNLYSFSYGTRVAYLYGLRYPQRIHRSFMCGINPPGGFVWEPDIVESQLRHYADLWNKDPDCVSKTPDLLRAMRNVLRSLPVTWNNIRIDPGKVKVICFTQLSHVSTSAMVFDAFVAAESGDLSGIAYLSVAYDLMMPNILSKNWGEACSKAVSADYDPKRDYESEMMPEGYILGSPVSKWLWGGMRYGGWPIRPIPEEYRKLQHSDVDTLMVSGNVDFATPLENARKLVPYLRNGHLVVLKEMGHVMDISGLQPEAFRHLAETFFLKGIVDDSKFVYQPMDFTPGKTFQEMAKELANKLGK